jgi:hypothetical protein
MSLGLFRRDRLILSTDWSRDREDGEQNSSGCNCKPGFHESLFDPRPLFDFAGIAAMQGASQNLHRFVTVVSVLPTYT